MKKIISLFNIAFIILFTSCSKSDSDDAIPDNVLLKRLLKLLEI